MSKTILAQLEHEITADTKLVVSHGVWRKRDYFDIRTHWRSPGGEWFPTKRGVRLTGDLAHQVHADLASRGMLDFPTQPSNGNTGPSGNGGGWGRNKKGGYKVNLGRSLRTPKRHHGIRCYGWNPYEGQPPVRQPIQVPRAFYAAMHGLSGHQGRSIDYLSRLCPLCAGEAAS